MLWKTRSPYRYRACVEYKKEFIEQLGSSSELWRGWSRDEEQHYKLERSLCQFFVSALSTFESFGFCLYYVGCVLSPRSFRLVATPRDIMLKTTTAVFIGAFAGASITERLKKLPEKPAFKRLSIIRNILVHRLAASRIFRVYGMTDADGTSTHTQEEILDVPGLNGDETFDE